MQPYALVLHQFESLMVHCTTFNKHGFEANLQAATFARIFDQTGKGIGRVRGRVFDRLSGRTEFHVVEYGCGRQVLVPRDLLKASGPAYKTKLIKDDLDRLPAFDLEILKDPRQWRSYQELHQMVLRNGASERFRAA
jgi:hypothetical protein